MDKKLSIDLFSNLYSMVIADGIIDPKEMELLNQIGHNVYKFTDEEITKAIVSTKSDMNCVPDTAEASIRLLYEMSLMAWVDGNVCEAEKKLLYTKAKNFGIRDEIVENLINRLLSYAENKTNENDVIEQLSK